MITQKAISAKIKFGLLEEIDEECALYSIKRNEFINNACRFYLKQRDDERVKKYLESNGIIPDEAKEGLTGEVYTIHLTDEDKRFLDIITSQTGKNASWVVNRALLILQKDYEKRPFADL